MKKKCEPFDDLGTFTALDFETSNSQGFSICQVGIVRYEKSRIVKKISLLVQPPGNNYSQLNISVHGITPVHTENSPTFAELYYDQIFPYINEKDVVFHNKSFDIKCLIDTCLYYDLDIPLTYTICTFELYPLNLFELSQAFGITYDPHDALSDAFACGEVYKKHLIGEKPNYDLIKKKKTKSYNFGNNQKVSSENFRPDYENADPNNIFYKKKVVLTGIFTHNDKNGYACMLKSNGADIDTSVTKRTNYLICGNAPGWSKLEKANKHKDSGTGIQIIKEDELITLLE